MLFKFVVVIAALYFELLLLGIGSEIIFGSSHGAIVDTSYRRKERLAAFVDFHNNPSPETRAKFQEELRLMHKHEDWKMYLAISLLVAINGVWIYYYFRERRLPNLKPDD
jgi:hypothetical protein